MLVRVERHELGPRLWWLERWRTHHWHAGVALIAYGVRLLWQDRADLPWPHPAPGVRVLPVPRVLPAWDPEIGQTTSHGEW